MLERQRTENVRVVSTSMLGARSVAGNKIEVTWCSLDPTINP